MAFASNPPSEVLPKSLANSLQVLLWGKGVKHEVFKRWIQGFIFSEDEPTALLQEEGGPCAVIAPVQAFLLKQLLFSTKRNSTWRECSGTERGLKLCEAFTEILEQAQTEGQPVALVSHTTPESVALRQPSSYHEGPEQPTTATLNGVMPDSQLSPQESSQTAKRQCLSHEEFHGNLQLTYCDHEDLSSRVEETMKAFQSQYGVLSFLCSVILTKGIESIKNELEDPGDALIDDVHGHGSQCLINLLLTGRAAPNVWDGDQEVSGLKLHGIDKQSCVGFLSYLEHLRYLEVGWFLKNPAVPVWLMGSETHITVLFSLDERLVDKGTPQSHAQQLFKQFDTEGRGFISSTDLKELLEKLDLVSEPEYVKIIQEKLDPEELGIITLNSFLEEFFPREETSSGESGEEHGMRFILYHYNGLPRSNAGRKVIFHEGRAFLPHMPDVQIITDSSLIRTCLMTKWPTIEMQWKDSIIPSMN